MSSEHSDSGSFTTHEEFVAYRENLGGIEGALEIIRLSHRSRWVSDEVSTLNVS